MKNAQDFACTRSCLLIMCYSGTILRTCRALEARRWVVGWRCLVRAIATHPPACTILSPSTPSAQHQSASAVLHSSSGGSDPHTDLLQPHCSGTGMGMKGRCLAVEGKTLMVNLRPSVLRSQNMHRLTQGGLLQALWRRWLLCRSLLWQVSKSSSYMMRPTRGWLTVRWSLMALKSWSLRTCLQLQVSLL